MQKLSLKYIWAILTAVLVIALVVELLRHLVFSDMNVWAGWGQWIGGIGALIAAYAALRISQKEATHRREEERRRQFVDAHYLALNGRCVRNWGKEPFVNIHVLRGGPRDAAKEPVNGVYLPLLLPTGNWDFGPLLDPRLRVEGHEFEVQYEDLAGRIWHKLGDQLPREITKTHHTWCPPPVTWHTTTPDYLWGQSGEK